jgi:predicted HicB family RNase H-like nuclease
MFIGYFAPYRGYTGTIEFSFDDRCYYGKIKNTRDLVNYEAKNFWVLMSEFENAVDDYLDFCKSVGKEVEVYET